MVNEGANCGNCAYQSGKYRATCNKCISRDGHQGWDPAEGVKVQIGEQWTGPKGRKRELIRMVIESEAI